jgi:hypothetical protein
MSDRHRGSSFDDFLREEGLYEDAEETAIRRVIAWQLQQEMETKRISKSEMARRMGPVDRSWIACSLQMTEA